MKVFIDFGGLAWYWYVLMGLGVVVVVWIVGIFVSYRILTHDTEEAEGMEILIILLACIFWPMAVFTLAGKKKEPSIAS